MGGFLWAICSGCLVVGQIGIDGMQTVSTFFNMGLQA